MFGVFDGESIGDDGSLESVFAMKSSTICIAIESWNRSSRTSFLCVVSLCSMLSKVIVLFFFVILSERLFDAGRHISVCELDFKFDIRGFVLTPSIWSHYHS